MLSEASVHPLSPGAMQARTLAAGTEGASLKYEATLRKAAS
jgi:hypothetical protein